MRDDTLALLVAGRCLEDESLVTTAMFERLREVAARVPGLVVIGAGDEAFALTNGDEHLSMRVVIGYVIERAQSEVLPDTTAAPLGPIDLEAVDDALRRARAIDALTRRAFANVVGRSILDAPDRVYLVANGPLATAVLARGTVERLPVDEDGYRLEGLEDGWVFHKGNNEQPEYAVRGDEVERVSAEGRGTVPIAPETLRGDLFLLAIYD